MPGTLESSVARRRGASLVTALATSFCVAACTQASPRAASGARQPSPRSAGAALPGAANPIQACPDIRTNSASASLTDFERPEAATPWFSYADGTAGGLFHREVTLEAGERVLHIISEGFHDWGSGIGVRLGTLTTARRSCAFDASGYSGIRFRARGSGSLRVAIATKALTPTEEGGGCALGRDCYDWPGADVPVSSAWATHELHFCELSPVGWGNASATIDPRALYALHFRFAEGQAHEVWLDDLEWIRSDTVNHGEPCGPVCPLTAAPRDATLAPAQISAEHAAAGLTVHTFDQATKRCGPLTRRYLSYLPRSFRAKSSAPVVIALHGHGASAEAFRDFQTHARFEALSERDGFIVVYANAAPGAATSPRLPNSGAWRQDPSSLEEVDDLGYLEAVRSDLQKREVIDGTNQVFLVGQSNGGGMVLEAARSNPGRFAGFAALMPYAGRSPAPPTPASPVGLTRVLFVYSEADPGLPAGYSGTLRALAEAWARVLGVPEAVVAAPIRTPLPDPVDEGAGYTGPLAILRATRQSRGERLDFAAERGSLQAPAVRLIVFDHAGHFWPNPLQDTAAFALEKWGLRNQDIDATDAVWDFFREVAKL